MKNRSKTNNIFTRYDINIEVDQQSARKVSEDKDLQKIADCIVSGNEDELEKLIKSVLQIKEPMDIINGGLIAGMKEVSRLWEIGVYFLPQVILSSDSMMEGIKLCEQKLDRPMKKKAKIVTHTAEGDIHDIGHVIVNALLNASGFEVINLGADVPVDEVIETCRIHKPIMVTGTALMTTTMTAFPKIAAGLTQMNLSIPLVCGGGAVNEEFITSFDLGIWGKEASQAPALAEAALNGLSWAEMRAKWNG